MEERSSREFVAPGLLAMPYESVGEAKRAQELTEEHYRQRGHAIVYFLYSELSHPEILRRMGLPW